MMSFHYLIGQILTFSTKMTIQQSWAWVCCWWVVSRTIFIAKEHALFYHKTHKCLGRSCLCAWSAKAAWTVRIQCDLIIKTEKKLEKRVGELGLQVLW